MSISKSDGSVVEHDAATIIQSSFRGFLARKRHAITQIPNQNREFYSVLIYGNDPLLEGLPLHSKEERIALIGTSGMRSADIACQLSSGITKLIIIDNSDQVIAFWHAARALIKKTSTTDLFLSELGEYVTASKCNRRGLTKIEFSYLNQLFDQYGFHKLQKIIGGVTVIAQSWADRDVMIKVKNCLTFLGIKTIYAYPSNIIAHLRAEGQRSNANQVIDNIELLNPALAIHTDLVAEKPERVFITADHSFASVSENLKLDSIKFNSSQNRSGAMEALLLMSFYKRLKGSSSDVFSSSHSSSSMPVLHKELDCISVSEFSDSEENCFRNN
jgi:hypothetical protein